MRSWTLTGILWPNGPRARRVMVVPACAANPDREKHEKESIQCSPLSEYRAEGALPQGPGGDAYWSAELESFGSELETFRKRSSPDSQRVRPTRHPRPESRPESDRRQ